MGRRSKAVSEIVAAMMLISIVVAASFVIYVYSSNLLGNLTGAQPSPGQYSNQLTLEYYDWTNVPSGGGPAQCSASQATPNCQYLVLQIRNVGTGLANIAAYYVNGVKVALWTGANPVCTSLSSTVVSTTTVTSIASLTPQGSCKVTLVMPATTTYVATCASTVTTTNLQTICVGVTYSVQIATTTGGVFAYNLVAGERTGSY